MSGKKKILHIAQSAGGVAQYIYMLLNNIDKSKYENILICSNDYKNQIERFKDLVSNIYYVDMVRNINPKSDIKAIFEIKKLIKKIKPNTVYMHSSKAGALGRIAMCFNCKIKKIYNAHGWYFNAEIGNKKKLMFTVIEKILSIKTDIIVNISQSEYDSAIQKKIAPPKKMCVINNGIDFEDFRNLEEYRDKLRAKYKIGQNEKLIGVVGRISEQKDPLTFIKSAKILNEKHKNLKFMFVGSGELEKEVIDYAKLNNFDDKVIITGWVNNVKEYISSFDVAVLPSKWEGFGLVIVEYMACRKPVVATKVGGIANIIKNDDIGLLVDKENEDKLAESIMKILEKNEDELNKITENNYTYSFNNYNIKNVLEEHYKIL